MLIYLLEKFVRRLCGRWLRKFEGGGQVNISMGGRIELSDLWLETAELSKMVLPFEPVAAHAGSVVVDLPLSTSGTLLVRMTDVDVILKAQDYDALDAEAARKAVEIAVNLYWTNYLRAPQGETAEPATLAETISAVVKSARIEIARAHVKIHSRNPLNTLADGLGPPVTWGVVLADLAVETVAEAANTAKIVKQVVCKDARLYHSDPDDDDHQKKQQQQGNTTKVEAEALIRSMREVWRTQKSNNNNPGGDYFWGATHHELLECCLDGDAVRLRVLRAELKASASLDSVAAAIREIPALVAPGLPQKLNDFSLPWLAELGLRCKADGVKGSLDSTLVAALLDAVERVSRSHRARQEAAVAVVGRRTDSEFRHVFFNARGRVVSPTEDKEHAAVSTATAPARAEKKGPTRAASQQQHSSRAPAPDDGLSEDDDQASSALSSDDESLQPMKTSTTKTPWAAVPGSPENNAYEDPRGELEFAQQQTVQLGVGRRLWATVRAAVLREQRFLSRRRRRRCRQNQDETPAVVWRRWFDEWRACGRYVTVRKLLAQHVRCGVFRADGEAYYDLNETCCVTRGGKFYTHPAQLSEDERKQSRELIRRQYCYKLDDSTSSSSCSRKSEFGRPTFASGGRSTFGSVPDSDPPGSPKKLSQKRVDPRTAVALYAEQLYLDSVLPANIAASLRAVAKRHIRAGKETAQDAFARTYSLDSGLLLVAPLKGALPVSQYMASDLRVEVQVATRSGQIIDKGRCRHSSVDGSTFDANPTEKSWLKDPVPLDAALELAVPQSPQSDETAYVRFFVVDRGGPFETRVAETRHPIELSCVDGRLRVPGRDVDAPLFTGSSNKGKPKPIRVTLGLASLESGGGGAEGRFELEVVVAYCLGRGASNGRKAVRQMCVDDGSFASPRSTLPEEERKKNTTTTTQKNNNPPPRETTLDSLKLELANVDVAVGAVRFEAARLHAVANPTVVPAARVHEPAASGEGSVLAAGSRLATAVLSTPSRPGDVLWTARGGRIHLPGSSGPLNVVSCRRSSGCAGCAAEKTTPSSGRHLAVAPSGAVYCSDSSSPPPALELTGPGRVFPQTASDLYFPGGRYELIDARGAALALDVKAAPVNPGLEATSVPALYVLGDEPLDFPLVGFTPIPEPIAVSVEDDLPRQADDDRLDNDVDDDVDFDDDDDEEGSKVPENIPPEQPLPPPPATAAPNSPYRPLVELTRNPSTPQQGSPARRDEPPQLDPVAPIAEMPETPVETVEFTCLKTLSACAIM